MSSHVLVLVAQTFNSHEFWVALGILRQRGHKVTVASTDYIITDDVSGEQNRSKFLISDIKEIDTFDALMVISGDWANIEEYWHEPKTQKIVKQFHTAEKPIAAICRAVTTIRRAAKGKRVSFFPLVRSRELLEKAGAILCSTSVTVDGNLVTAEHQMATQMWAEAFCAVLEKKTPEIMLKPVESEPSKIERKPIPELEVLKDITNRTGKVRVKK